MATTIPDRILHNTLSFTLDLGVESQNKLLQGRVMIGRQFGVFSRVQACQTDFPRFYKIQTICSKVCDAERRR